MKNISSRCVVVLLAFTAFGCSSNSEDEDKRGSGITGHSEAILAEDIDQSEQTSSPAPLQALFEELGAKPELAECYADVYVVEGIADGIEDAVDLSKVQQELTEEQKVKVEECGSNSE